MDKHAVSGHHDPGTLIDAAIDIHTNKIHPRITVVKQVFSTFHMAQVVKGIDVNVWIGQDWLS